MEDKENSDSLEKNLNHDEEQSSSAPEDDEQESTNENKISVEQEAKSEDVENQIDINEELKETKDKLLRSLAENENVRKQIEKIRMESIKYGPQPLARELLSVIDNFQRAIDTHAKNEQDNVIEGFELIKKELSSIFDKFNIKKVKALGENFDANFHQAMFEKPSEKYEKGKVCEVVQDGYLFHERLLRPALVGVAKQENIESVDEEKNDNDKSNKEQIDTEEN